MMMEKGFPYPWGSTPVPPWRRVPNAQRWFTHEVFFHTLEREVNDMNLVEIADQGNDLETLKQLRHKIAQTIDESKSGRDIASLSRQLQKVMDAIKELEALEKANAEDTILDIVRRKKAQRVRDEQRRTPYESDL